MVSVIVTMANVTLVAPFKKSASMERYQFLALHLAISKHYEATLTHNCTGGHLSSQQCL